MKRTRGSAKWGKLIQPTRALPVVTKIIDEMGAGHRWSPSRNARMHDEFRYIRGNRCFSGTYGHIFRQHTVAKREQSLISAVSEAWRVLQRHGPV